MESSTSEAVLESSRRLIRRAQTVVPTYAAGPGLCGASTRELSALFTFTRTRIKERRMHGLAAGMAVPTVDGHKIILDPTSTRSDRMFTIRHELGHILADEVQYALFLTAQDTMSFSERRADLFAVADLTPTKWMDWMRGRGRPWKHLTLEVKQAFRELTEGWSEQRLNDRAKLRVELYRKRGI